MLYDVFGLLFFLGDRFFPSKLPSRELLALVICDSGSANMTEAVLLLGDGGPEVEGSWARMASDGRFLSGCFAAPSGPEFFASRALLESSSVAKGLNMPMRLVGSEGTQRDCPKAGCCAGAVAAAILFASLWKDVTVKTNHSTG